MSNNIFPSLSDDAHVWIQASNRPLKNKELKALENELIDFMSNWTSHGRAVQSEFRLVERRVLILAASLPEGKVSGCGIDDLMHRLDKIARNLDFQWNGPLDVFYRDKDGLYQQTSRKAFGDLLEQNSVSGDTPILDFSVSNLGEVRESGIERAAHDSWVDELYSFK